MCAVQLFLFSSCASQAVITVVYCLYSPRGLRRDISFDHPMSCTIKSCFIIEADHMSRPWILDTKEANEKTFVRLNKWDYGLVRFATNKTLNFKKGTHETLNMNIMDRLCQLRNAACDKLFVEHTQQPLEDGSKGKKRKYVRVAKASDLVFLPEAIQIDLPSVKGDDGRIIDGHSTWALSEGLRTSNLYLELSDENVAYIRNCTVHSTLRGRHWRKPNPEQAPVADDDTLAEDAF